MFNAPSASHRDNPQQQLAGHFPGLLSAEAAAEEVELVTLLRLVLGAPRSDKTRKPRQASSSIRNSVLNDMSSIVVHSFYLFLNCYLNCILNTVLAKKNGQLIIYPRWPPDGRFQINYFWSLVLNGRKNRPTITLLLTSIN